MNAVDYCRFQTIIELHSSLAKSVIIGTFADCFLYVPEASAFQPKPQGEGCSFEVCFTSTFDFENSK
jgi:hypothetical protein